MNKRLFLNFSRLLLVSKIYSKVSTIEAITLYNKKPFHIDRELEGPILFKDVLLCLRTSYPILERPNTVLERPILI